MLTCAMRKVLSPSVISSPWRCPNQAGYQLGEHFERQRHFLACHVEVHHDSCVAGLCGGHVDVQQLESCTRDVLQYGKTLLVAQKQWLANRHYYV